MSRNILRSHLMKNENMFFETPFYQKSVNKTYIDVSICKSNIKEETFYARPCKSGFVKSDELLKLLEKRVPYIDAAMMEAAFAELGNLIINLVSSGKTVELFSLGSFSLSTKGKVEVEKAEMHYLQEEDCDVEAMEAKEVGNITSGSYNLDVSPIIKSKPRFTLQFEQSSLVKKTLENMEMNVAIKKKKAPTIFSITNIVQEDKQKIGNELPTILQIKGEDLKIAKNTECRKDSNVNEAEQCDAEMDAKVGIYMEESGSGKMRKLPEENILKNTPKELIVILDEKIEPSKTYNLAIATQYVKMGEKRVGRILRGTKVVFSKETIGEAKTCSKLKKALIPLKQSYTSSVQNLILPIQKFYICKRSDFAKTRGHTHFAMQIC